MSERRVERRLAAILMADVAGYSRLVGEDEEGTLERLKVLRRTVADPKIKEHRGRVVRTTGDGLLIEFVSVVDAVRCAVEVQREMALRNAEVPANQRIEFRIGINLGDIIKDGQDVYGDGVNVAARLEALSARCALDIADVGEAFRPQQLIGHIFGSDADAAVIHQSYTRRFERPLRSARSRRTKDARGASKG
jgi:class 3 adenylate cyclase